MSVGWDSCNGYEIKRLTLVCFNTVHACVFLILEMPSEAKSCTLNPYDKRLSDETRPIIFLHRKDIRYSLGFLCVFLSLGKLVSFLESLFRMDANGGIFYVPGMCEVSNISMNYVTMQRATNHSFVKIRNKSIVIVNEFSIHNVKLRSILTVLKVCESHCSHK